MVKITAQKPSALRTTELIRYLNLSLYLNQKVFEGLVYALTQVAPANSHLRP